MRMIWHTIEKGIRKDVAQYDDGRLLFSAHSDGARGAVHPHPFTLTPDELRAVIKASADPIGGARPHVRISKDKALTKPTMALATEAINLLAEWAREAAPFPSFRQISRKTRDLLERAREAGL